MTPKILSLSLNQASEITGLSRAELRKLIEEGQLPALRMGTKKYTCYRVKLSDLDALFRFHGARTA